MNKNTIIGAAIIILGLFTPFYIGFEVLPEGWVGERGDSIAFWWTLPTMVCLTLAGFCTILAGMFKIFVDKPNH